MKFELFFTCDNAAFEPNAEIEISRILREWAEKIDNGEFIFKYRTIRDINGNDIGRIKLHEGE